MFFIIFTLFIITYASAADDECLCSDAEVEAVFKFLTTLDKNEILLPNLLSPLVSCQCEENSRKKRKIFPDPTSKPGITTKKEPSEEKLPKKVAEKTHSVQKNVQDTPKQETTTQSILRSRNCPVGYRRIGFMCLNLR